MRPREENRDQGELFERELETLVRSNHRLVKLCKRIDWSRFDERFGVLYVENVGRPGVSTRLMAGLAYLKYLHDVSDETVMEMWLENPYWQYFCGERYFQHDYPCDRSSMSRWRKKIGEKGAQELFDESLAVARDVGILKMKDLEELYVDTTVQEKNIAYPSEANLLNKARVLLVKLCKEHEIEIRQTYKRLGQRHKIKAHQYAAAQQWNRARKEIRKLRTYLGRIIRELERVVSDAKRAYFEPLLALCKKLYHSKDTGEKVLSLHEPHVEAIAKGKMYKRFEFGNKVSVTSTRRNGIVVGIRSIHGNPYDGHTLQGALHDVEERLGKKLFSKVGVDLGYRGHGIKERFKVLHPRLKKIPQKIRKFIRGRSKIEAGISLLKRCFRLGKNYLKGILGDLQNALFSGGACNLSRVLAAL